MDTLLLTITLISVTGAIGAGLYTWRVIRHDRQRSEARIAALAAAISDGDPGEEAVVELPIRAAQAPPMPDDRFALERPLARGSRGLAVALAGAAVVTVIIGSIVITSSPRDSSGARSADRAVADTPAPNATALPLELIALGHERELDRLTIRGVIRSSSTTAGIGQLTAVVMLFNRDGAFIASGRAAVHDSDAAPGAERRFIVSVPAAAEVGRYRVSFTNDDRIVPHVDKRTDAGTQKSVV